MEELLPGFLREHGYFLTHDEDYFAALLHAQRRQRWLIIEAGIFACLLVLMLFGAGCIRRQRNQMDAAGAALRQIEQKLRSWRTT
jgi:hypothetical protein